MNTRYVLLTAAKNEEACIGETLRLVARQTIKPLAWYIMDDGSSDRTAVIINSFAAGHSFIRLQSTPSGEKRNFASKDRAVMRAYDLASSLEFDFVGIQDADQAPEREDYYELILQEFGRNPRLGMASGFLYERHRGVWECRQGNSEDAITGGTAMFRRSSFDQIGGYTPLYYGGEDALAQYEVERAGWEILTRPDLHIFHFRRTSSAGGVWRGLFRAGLEDASLGYHPVFEFFRCGRRLLHRPLFGSLAQLSGYLWWSGWGRKPVIKPETAAFIRRRQMRKLRRWTLARRRETVGLLSGIS